MTLSRARGVLISDTSAPCWSVLVCWMNEGWDWLFIFLQDTMLKYILRDRDRAGGLCHNACNMLAQKMPIESISNTINRTLHCLVETNFSDLVTGLRPYGSASRFI